MNRYHKKVVLAIAFFISISSYFVLPFYRSNIFSSSRNLQAVEKFKEALKSVINLPNSYNKASELLNRHFNLHHDDADLHFYGTMPNKTLSNTSTSPADYYCTFPKKVHAHIAEGKANPGWKLKQVHIVIRHGDRVPLLFDFYQSQQVRPDFCNIVKDPMVKEHEILGNFREYIKTKLTSKHGHVDFSWLKSLCKPAQLTNIGMLQHLYIGLSLRKIYFGKLKFASVDTPGLRVFSTNYQRTYMSAMALSYGLLPNFARNQVPIHFVPNVNFCFKHCFCPRESESMNKLINRWKKSIYNGRQKENKTLQRIATTLHIGDRPGSQMDKLVTGFHCKNLKLPCSKGKCVTESDLNVIMDEQEYKNWVLSTHSPFRNQSLLRTQPMLDSMVKAMHFAARGSKGTRKFFLYSGHDLTIRPLLSALNIPDFRWPRLASRLVFELWEYERKHYVRVIYNGNDVTETVSFCKKESGSHGCSLEVFSDFVTTGILKHFGVKSRREACGAM